MKAKMLAVSAALCALTMTAGVSGEELKSCTANTASALSACAK